jgi:hypothetical protein
MYGHMLLWLVPHSYEFVFGLMMMKLVHIASHLCVTFMYSAIMRDSWDSEYFCEVALFHFQVVWQLQNGCVFYFVLVLIR